MIENLEFSSNFQNLIFYLLVYFEMMILVILLSRYLTFITISFEIMKENKYLIFDLNLKNL